MMLLSTPSARSKHRAAREVPMMRGVSPEVKAIDCRAPRNRQL
jgi:hypothetical protein